MGRPRSIASSLAARRPGRSDPQRLRLPSGAGARRRSCRDLARRPCRVGHPGSARAGAPRRRRQAIRQALAQAGPQRMSTNGVAGGLHDKALIGEVVEASTTEFLAQALELDSAPPFGAFVEVATDDSFSVFGVVARVETSGIDPGAKAIMRGHGD